MTFALILSSLVLIPVRCYSEPVGPAAFYQPGPDAHIALGPEACSHVRRATLYGGYIVAHELAHFAQDRYGRPFDEAEADRVGWAAAWRWQRVLARVFGVRLVPTVRLAGR